MGKKRAKETTLDLAEERSCNAGMQREREPQGSVAAGETERERVRERVK